MAMHKQDSALDTLAVVKSRGRNGVTSMDTHHMHADLHSLLCTIVMVFNIHFIYILKWITLLDLGNVLLEFKIKGPLYFFVRNLISLLIYSLHFPFHKTIIIMSKI